LRRETAQQATASAPARTLSFSFRRRYPVWKPVCSWMFMSAPVCALRFICFCRYAYSSLRKSSQSGRNAARLSSCLHLLVRPGLDAGRWGLAPRLRGWPSNPPRRQNLQKRSLSLQLESNDFPYTERHVLLRKRAKLARW